MSRGPKKPMIYLDLDGVGADWLGYVTKYHFVGLNQEQLNAIPNQHIELREMYTRDRHMFFNLEPLPGFQRIVDHLNRVGCDWRILTACGFDHPYPEIVKEDKISWLKDNFQIGEPRITVVEFSPDKAFYADSESLLIDDYIKNCDQFKSAGGHAFHVKSSDYDPLDIITAINNFLSNGRVD